MKLDDLDLRDLLAFEPKGGVVRFAGDRALILDAVALGVLRKTLIDTLGERGARGVLTRFGFTHGQRTAIAILLFLVAPMLFVGVALLTELLADAWRTVHTWIR